MKTRKFTAVENRILTEVYRRLNYFNKSDLNTNLLIKEIPSEVKRLINKNILTCSNGREAKRIFNWYKLTSEGKKLFSNYITKITEAENLQIFDGRRVVNFNKPLTEQA